MTAQECLDTIEVIGANWPFWIRALSDRQITLLASSWATVLADFDARIVHAALAQYMGEAHEFAPQVGQLKALAQQMIDGARGETIIDAGEAWRLACNAVIGFGHGAYWDAERKDKLPAEVVKAAEHFGLMRIRERLADQEATNFAQFRDIYNQLAQRERSQRATPPAVRQLMQDLAKQLGAERARKQLPGGER